MAVNARIAGMVFLGKPGGMSSAIGILNWRAQRSRSLPIHSALSRDTAGIRLDCRAGEKGGREDEADF